MASTSSQAAQATVATASTSGQATVAIASTSRQADEVAEVAQPGESTSGSPPRKKSVMEDLLDDMFQTNAAPNPITVPQSIQREISVYKAQPSIALSCNPLDRWRENCHTFPHLAVLARIYLGIPATSVQGERMFSTAGDVVTAQRSRLSGEHVDQLIVVKNFF